MSLDPWVPDAVCETHEYRAPDGDVIRFVTRVEATQRMMPPVTVYSVRVPDAHGARFRKARHDERLVALPVVVPGPQSDRDELRRWARVLDPSRGEGVLAVVQGDWAGRQIPCVYAGGLDSYAEQWPSIGLTTLAFHCADPYWQDSTESAITATLTSTSYTWFPFPPLRLGSSDVFASVTITNVGDVDAWPTISVDGPGNDLTLTNQTTGQTLVMLGAVAAGSRVEIDTRPGHKSVTVDGFNAFSRLTVASSLWPIVPGANRVDIGFASATVDSAARFAWRSRWMAA